MSHWIENIIRINAIHDGYRWELLTLDEGMITIRYSEKEDKEWVVKQEIEMVDDVARTILKEEFFPRTEEINDTSF